MSPRVPYGIWFVVLGGLLLLVSLSWQPSLPFSLQWPPLVVPAMASLAVGFAQLLLAYRRKS
ncbi:MAG: hypothetical protein AAGK14_08555 [Verrucomicrobiota bacterium]